MMAFPPAAGPISVRQLIEVLTRLDDQGGPIGVALFDRSGQVTVQAACNVAVHNAGSNALGDDPPVILIVAGNPPSQVSN